MSPASPLVAEALRHERERVIGRLTEAFAGEQLELDELERRLTLAHRAEGSAELAPLVGDLDPAAAAALGAAARSHGASVAAPPGAAGALAGAERPILAAAIADLAAARAAAAGHIARLAAPALASLTTPRDHQSLVAFMGAVSRRGPWIPPRQLQVVAIMGGAELDFRDAQLAPGVTEIAILVVCGGVQITVPPTLAVEVEGMGIMGGFDDRVVAPVATDPTQPRLRVRGLAVMGGVGFDVRIVGESRRQARQRRRHERRLRRRAQQRLLTGRSP